MPCKANNEQVIINALQNRVYASVYYGLPESIILNRAGSLKGNQMRAHLEVYGISPEFVAADNHRANWLAEWVIREFNDRMNLKCKDHWKAWHKTIKDTELSLRTNPNENTDRLPAEFLFRRPMQTTFRALPGLVDLKEYIPRCASKRLVATRLHVQDVIKCTDEQPSSQPHKPHAYTFQQGEQVLFKTHNDGGIEGLPARW